MHGLNRKIAFLLTFMLLGVAVTIQLRSTFYINSTKTSVSLRISSYNAQLVEEKKKVEDIKKIIDVNQTKKDEFLKTFSAIDVDITRNLLGEELFDARFKAGLTDVKGKGMIIILDDAPARQVDDPNLLIIHDNDVTGIINILKVAGAQAISINGERLISTSEQVCAGPTIRINKNRYSVPYEIKVIGDQARMETAINGSVLVAEMLSSKIKVEIQKFDELLITKYNYNLDDQLSGMEAK